MVAAGSPKDPGLIFEEESLSSRGIRLSAATACPSGQLARTAFSCNNLAYGGGAGSLGSYEYNDNSCNSYSHNSNSCTSGGSKDDLRDLVLYSSSVPETKALGISMEKDCKGRIGGFIGRDSRNHRSSGSFEWILRVDPGENRRAAARQSMPRCQSEAMGLGRELGSPLAGGARSDSVDNLTMAQLTQLDQLGAGAFATAYKARLTTSLKAGPKKNDLVCLKVLRDGASPDQAYHEVEALRQVQHLGTHENVVELYGCNLTTIPYFIVMEFVAGWSLQAEIRRRGRVPLRYIKKWGSEIIMGLKHLHTSNLLHRDLKSSNVMLRIVSKKEREAAAKGGKSSKSGKSRRDEGEAGVSVEAGIPAGGSAVAKIVDFGETKNLNLASPLTKEVGTWKWMAPEVMALGVAEDGVTSYGPEADVYSLGMLLYEMAVGHEPFKGMAPMQAAFAVAKQRRPTFKHVTCPPLLEFAVRMCLHTDPNKRPTLGVLLGLLTLLDPLPGDNTAAEDPTGGVLVKLNDDSASMLDAVSPKPAAGSACERFLRAVPAAAYLALVELQENGAGLRPATSTAAGELATTAALAQDGRRSLGAPQVRVRSTSLVMQDCPRPMTADGQPKASLAANLPRAGTMAPRGQGGGTPRGRMGQLSAFFGRVTGRG